MAALQHTIQLGDSLQSVGRMHGVSMNDLLAANPALLTEPVLCVGMVLTVPDVGGVPTNCYPGATQPIWPTQAATPAQPMWPATPTQPAQPSWPSSPIQPGTPSNGTGSGNASLESQVIALVNSERASRGLTPLAVNDTLTEIARVKSGDMAANNYFSHNSPTYGSPFEMLRSFGVGYSTAGENIASGQTTAESVMDTWMNSPGHAANILNDAYTEIGVGVAENNGRPIWTQIFVRP